MKNASPPPSPQQRHSAFGILSIMLGAFSFSIMFLLVKIMGKNANTFTLVLYRSLVQIIISLGTLLHADENPLGPPDCRFWLVIRGVFGSAAVCAWFFGIQILPLPDAVTLQFTTPPFAAVVRTLVEHECAAFLPQLLSFLFVDCLSVSEPMLQHDWKQHWAV